MKRGIVAKSMRREEVKCYERHDTRGLLGDHKRMRKGGIHVQVCMTSADTKRRR